jgi:hypothetical protein
LPEVHEWALSRVSELVAHERVVNARVLQGRGEITRRMQRFHEPCPNARVERIDSRATPPPLGLGSVVSAPAGVLGELLQ